MMSPKEVQAFAREAEYYGTLAEGGLLSAEQCQLWREAAEMLEELRELELEEFGRFIASVK